jgi:hypothetical protein
LPVFPTGVSPLLEQGSSELPPCPAVVPSWAKVSINNRLHIPQ